MNDSGAGKGFDIYASKDRLLSVVLVSVVSVVVGVGVGFGFARNDFVGKFDVVLFGFDADFRGGANMGRGGEGGESGDEQIIAQHDSLSNSFSEMKPILI